MTDIIDQHPLEQPAPAFDPAGAAASIADARTGLVFLRVQQEEGEHPGQVTYGVDDTAASPESDWVIPWHQIAQGWMRREDEGVQVIDEQFFPAVSTPPDKRPPRPSASHRPAWRARLMCVRGPDDGVVAEMGGDSMGVAHALGGLLTLIYGQHSAHGARASLHPVVRISSTSYRSAKKMRTIWKPVIDVQGWMSEAQLRARVEAARAAAPAAVPAPPAPPPPPPPSEQGAGDGEPPEWATAAPPARVYGP